MKKNTQHSWAEYKREVGGSRQHIVLPFLLQHLAGQTGVGLDIGCGDGDLTREVATTLGTKLLGIDLDVDMIAEAQKSSDVSTQVHFTQGNIEKNAIPALRMRFDFSFSNCCLSHIDDEAVHRLLLDLYTSLKDDAIAVFLVPSITWARQMYRDIEWRSSGLTAIPRYGDRQVFRIPEWYVAAFEQCGFEVIKQEEVKIPNDVPLEERYRANVGSPLFSGFVVRRLSRFRDAEAREKSFEIAHENRKLEIQLFWQRSLFFWGFVAAALLGYATAYSKSESLTLAFSLFGLVCSVVWSRGNRGSKYWQEYWEGKVSFYQHYTTGNIFFDREPKAPKLFDIFEAQRTSVSKLTMALSDYTIALWAGLSAHLLLKPFVAIPDKYVPYFYAGMTVLTLLYCWFVLRLTGSED